MGGAGAFDPNPENAKAPPGAGVGVVAPPKIPPAAGAGAGPEPKKPPEAGDGAEPKMLPLAGAAEPKTPPPLGAVDADPNIFGAEGAGVPPNMFVDGAAAVAGVPKPPGAGGGAAAGTLCTVLAPHVTMVIKERNYSAAVVVSC